MPCQLQRTSWILCEKKKKETLIVEFIRQKQQVFEKSARSCLSAITVYGVSFFQVIFGQIIQNTTVL